MGSGLRRNRDIERGQEGLENSPSGTNGYEHPNRDPGEILKATEPALNRGKKSKLLLARFGSLAKVTNLLEDIVQTLLNTVEAELKPRIGLGSWRRRPPMRLNGTLTTPLSSPPGTRRISRAIFLS